MNKASALKRNLLIGLVFFSPLMLLMVRHFWEANYLVSSSYKLIFLVPIVYRVFFHKTSFKNSIKEGFSIKAFKKHFFKSLGLGLILASIYLAAYFLFKDFIDFIAIQERIDDLASINASNIILIGAYIILINSLLEEFFWRGFLFNELNKFTSRIFAYLFTGIAFSFHHIMFIFDWFPLHFLALATLGLIGYAIILNYVFEKHKDLFSCWFIHIFGDIVQIFIALKIFAIL
jgi:uncharacterized protein